MAQSSIVINGNQSGLGYTTDLNAALMALGTINSGASAPSTTYAYLPWVDTSTGLLKLRNASNSGWVTIGKVDSSLLNRDMSQIYISDTSVSANALTVTPDPAFTAYAAGMTLLVKVAVTNTGTTTINVNALGAKTIKKVDGTSNLVAGDIVAGQLIALTFDGTNFQLLTPPGTPATITDGSIALTKFAAQTAGSLLSYNGSNTPTLIAPGTSGQFLKTNGAGSLPSWSTLSLGSMMSNVDGTAPTDNQLLKFVNSTGKWTPSTVSTAMTTVSYTSNGTFTVPTGVTQIFIRVVGAGGGGGDGNGTSWGGNAGGVVTGWATVTPGASISYTIGAGSRNAGGNTVFGTICTAYGGQPAGGNIAMGTCDTAQTGLTILGGSMGQSGSSGAPQGGIGCGGVGGQGKVGGFSTSGTPSTKGAGGASGTFNGGTGDNGAPGVVIISYFA